MSRQRDREEFVRIMGQELPEMPLDVVRGLMRAGATLQRLAEAQCNGDWPADHGDAWKTETCSECEGGWHPSALKEEGKVCPDCRTQARVRKVLAEYGAGVVFQGDPRGCVFKVRVPSGRTNDSAREGVCVPS